MKVYVSINLCAIAKFDTMLWGLMRRAFTLFIDITSLCLFHSAFMGVNNVLGGSFALLIDGQMVYKQVPLLFPVFLSFDTRQYYGVLATNSMFVNLTFGHNTSECQ